MEQTKQRKTYTSVFNLNYHFVWCPKYRKPFMEGKYKKFIEEHIPKIAKEKGVWPIELKVMPDHIHLFLSAPPQKAPSNIVKFFKGILGLRLFREFPELKKEFWGGHLWSPSYYVGSAGHVSADAIQKYINSQRQQP
ncbi:MAG: IS200/IS605 family transposase [Candidatus Cloacimonadia bacterium]